MYNPKYRNSRRFIGGCFALNGVAAKGLCFYRFSFFKASIGLSFLSLFRA